MTDPYGLGFDVANRGLGDVSLLLTRKLGAINDTSVTLSVGLPTGAHQATLVRDRNILLPQDRQLGLGKPTASLTVDHTLDQVWGLFVLGGAAAWRGGENALPALPNGTHPQPSYRAPSATAYGYTAYFLGPVTPSLGVQLTGFAGADRDQGAPQRSPRFIAAPQLSLEWASDLVAVLIGASVPYQYDGETSDNDGNPRSPWGFGPWMVAVGVAVSPF
jgi:hypothetical protein